MRVHLTCTNKGWSIVLESNKMLYNAFKGGEIRYEEGVKFVFGKSLYIKVGDKSFLYDGIYCDIDFDENIFEMCFNDVNQQLVIINLPDIRSILQKFIVNFAKRADNEDLVDSFVECWNNEVVFMLEN